MPKLLKATATSLASALCHILAMVLYPSPRRSASGLPKNGETQRRSRPPPSREVPAILAIRESDVGWKFPRLVVHWGHAKPTRTDEAGRPEPAASSHTYPNRNASTDSAEEAKNGASHQTPLISG